jgi:hypothetical protein
MGITNKTWAIIGGAAALVIVPAGVAFGVAAAQDQYPLGHYPPEITERAPARAGVQDGSGVMGGGMFGPGARSDRDRVQARDGSYCDGDGPIGRAGDGDRRGPGMMGGDGRGAMGGYGPGNR